MALDTIRPNSSASRLRSEPVKIRTMPSGPLRRPSDHVAEAVADPADRDEVLGLLRIALELLAQVADVDVDRPRVAVRRVAPDAGEQHVAREDPTRAAGECHEDLELDVGDRDLPAAHGHGALAGVDAELE